MRASESGNGERQAASRTVTRICARVEIVDGENDLDTVILLGFRRWGACCV